MAVEMKLLLIAVSLLAGLFPTVEACQVCVPFPTKSAADYLIEADAVVLAREDPDRPFHFRAVEVLMGDPGTEKIDLFLDSSSRRTLATYPERSVVLVRKTEKDKADWRRIGMADEDFELLVREILRSANAWKRTPRLRFDYFGKLLGHGNLQINSLAHLEVAAAPYSEIKRLKGVLPREVIYDFLNDYRYVEWHALYILLLAQSEDAEDREFISDSFRSAARFGITNRLGAWATAAVELDEDKALGFIEAEYFRNRSRTPEEIKEITSALSVHGTNGHTHLRDRIVAGFKILIANHPSITADVANNLIAWKRTELKDEIAKYLATNPRSVDFQTTLRLRAYGRQGKAGHREAETHEK